MLTIERAVDESFVIGSDTVVRVVSIEGDSVRLAIANPRQQPRYREVVLKIGATAPVRTATAHPLTH